MAWEHPDLNRFRERVERSSELHQTAINPRDNRIHREGMDPDEKRRVVDESAAQIRRAMGDA